MLLIGASEFLANLLLAVADVAASVLKSHKSIRNAILIIGALAFLIASAITAAPTAFGLSPQTRVYGAIAIIAIIFIISPALVAATSLRVKDLLGGSSPYIVGEQLSGIAEERRVLEKRLADDSAPGKVADHRKEAELFDTNLELNLNELKEYYVINKSQARTSFAVGVTAVILGLITILVGVGLLYAGSGQKSHVEVATITAVAGLLAQFIGGSCFYLFNKSQNQSAHYYDRLTELQGTLLAVRLTGSITNVDLANMTRQHIVFGLMKLEPPGEAAPKTRARARNRQAARPAERSPNGTVADRQVEPDRLDAN